MNSQYDQLPVTLIAQLVEHCTGNTEVMRSNPIQPDWLSVFILTVTISHVLNNKFC